MGAAMQIALIFICRECGDDYRVYYDTANAGPVALLCPHCRYVSGDLKYVIRRWEKGVSPVNVLAGITRGVGRVHFVVASGLPYCGQRKGKRFSEDWEKVDCLLCLRLHRLENGTPWRDPWPPRPKAELCSTCGRIR